MKTMEFLVKKHLSEWQDTIAKANSLGASPGSLQMMEAALKDSMKLVEAMASDYDVVVGAEEPVVVKQSAPKVEVKASKFTTARKKSR